MAKSIGIRKMLQPRRCAHSDIPAVSACTNANHMKLLACVCVLLFAFMGSVDCRSCQLITQIPGCETKRIGYNYTSLPYDQSLKLARQKLRAYQSLFQSNCADVLNFFICADHLPICAPGHTHVVPPCRRACLAVHAQCGHKLKEFGLSGGLTACDQLPDASDPIEKPMYDCFDPWAGKVIGGKVPYRSASSGAAGSVAILNSAPGLHSTALLIGALCAAVRFVL